MNHSTGYRNLYYTRTIVTPGMFDGGAVNLYTGAPPASADAAPTGTLLVSIALPTPAFGSPVAGLLTANAVTPGTVAASGTVGYARCVSATDGGGLSTTDPRWQFSVGISAAEMILNTLGLIIGGNQTIASFTVTAPT